MMSLGNSFEDARLMSWEKFRANFLDEGIAADIPVAGNPLVTVFAEPLGGSIGLKTRIPDGSTAPSSPIDAIVIDTQAGFLTIRTSDRGLFQPFFAFLLDVSNRIQLDGKEPGAAFIAALAVWRRMLTPSSAMDSEKQLGLVGELWVLERLLRVKGPSSVAAWTGANWEAHDFRLGNSEVEVKTTSGEYRRHIISRLDQLMPSPGMNLYLLSLQMADAGMSEGRTLPEQVATTRALVGGDIMATSLEEKLRNWGWRDDDAAHYPRKWRLRSPGLLVPVDKNCPRIVKETLKTTLGPLAERIDDVKYRIDVEGLGTQDGTPVFTAIIPEYGGQK